MIDAEGGLQASPFTFGRLYIGGGPTKAVEALGEKTKEEWKAHHCVGRLHCHNRRGSVLGAAVRRA